MSEFLCLEVPFSAAVTRGLEAGQRLLLTGMIYGARDQAHRRFAAVLARGEELPLNLKGEVIYYVGPTPPRPGQVCGAAGPTTSGRMDPFTPPLLAYGVRGLMGKGNRSAEVVAALKQYGAVYLAATGGAGALLSRCIEEIEVVAYPELGPEAVFRLRVRDFPAIVAVDSRGRNLYETGPTRYRVALP
ncbi:MAG: FumA C-terminus/TtdB family hydratase beta subunit [Bacillota bacterium]|jgi:fumarate hydratase subunit beta|nr:FumA C-terminus/TtdB family hydratase beta subunit [Bacillota bacterium]